MNSSVLQNKRVLLTGGTGFVGSRVVPMLLDAGARVTLLCRSSSRTSHLPDTVTVVRTDLRNSTDFLDELAQCDIFIHMAALLFGLGWQDYLKDNCGVAQNLAGMLHTLGNRGPRRVILVSSLAAAGPCDRDPGRTEEEACCPVSAYGWSKYLSENILHSAAKDRLVILRPPIIYGSGDLGLLPVFRGLAKGVGVLPGLGRPFPVSVIHVDDVARAILLVCEPRAQGIYHLSDGKTVTMADFYRQAAKALGREAHLIPLPLWFMGLAALASSGAATLTSRLFSSKGRAPNWNLDKFREARQCGWIGCNGRIVSELGFAPAMDLATGMEEAVAGYKKRQLL